MGFSSVPEKRNATVTCKPVMVFIIQNFAFVFSPKIKSYDVRISNQNNPWTPGK